MSILGQLSKALSQPWGQPLGIRRLATSIEVPLETYSQRLHNLRKNSIDQGEAHFRIGERRIYFPSARVVLVRPNAKHSPYQAKFLVPKSFNKLDLRDYLYNIYGLRALKITTQLYHSKYERSLPMPIRPRHRSPQVKKMTITMLEPFIWPLDEKSVEFMEKQKRINDQSTQYYEDAQSVGSAKLKPSKLYGGIVDPLPKATNFIPKKLGRKMNNNKLRDLTNLYKQEQLQIIKKHFS